MYLSLNSRQIIMLVCVVFIHKHVNVYFVDLSSLNTADLKN